MLDDIVKAGFLLAIALLALSAEARADAPTSAGSGNSRKGRPPVSFWLETSLKRLYPDTPPASRPVLRLLAARNSRLSFQACLRNDRSLPMKVECAATAEGGLSVRVRRVGYVPVRFGTTEVEAGETEGPGHVPGFVPDPLFPDQNADIGPYETAAFWITLQVPADTRPGEHQVNVRLAYDAGKGLASLEAVVDVRELTIQLRRDFPVTNWWRAECLWDWYRTGMFEDERWWNLARAYIRDLVEHGNDVVYVPLFFMRRETFARPAQLLKVTEPAPGRYAFDFADARRFVRMARECGAQRFEWPHLWIYWGVVNPIRVYTWKDKKAVMLWPPDSDGHGPVYHNFLRQFLPAFHRFLQEEDLLTRSYFHLSDEPSAEHIPNYRRAREFLRETAPWMKVMDALSDVNFGKQGLTDTPIPLISSAPDYIKAGLPHWVYFCCAPRGPYLQRLLDTPLPKIRMAGWLFYRLGAKGFLHWGYNYWHAMEQERLIDPFREAAGESWPGIPPGDPFMVYPGPDGPIDSIRWEVFAESLQDYALLQSAGIRPDAPMLSAIKDYADFPKTEKWIDSAIKKALNGSGR